MQPKSFMQLIKVMKWNRIPLEGSMLLDAILYILKGLRNVVIIRIIEFDSYCLGMWVDKEKNKNKRKQ